MARTYCDVEIVARKNARTLTGYMYILPTCIEMSISDIKKNVHYAVDPKLIGPIRILVYNTFIYNISWPKKSLRF